MSTGHLKTLVGFLVGFVCNKHAQGIDRKRRECGSGIPGRHRQPRPSNGKKLRGGLRSCDRDLQPGGDVAGSASELCADRVSIAKKATESADVEHNSRRAMA